MILGGIKMEKKYYLEGNTIRLIRYIITYSIDKESDTRTFSSQGKIYVHNADLLEKEKEKLYYQGATYTVEELDVSNIEDFDNVIVSDEQDAENLINPNIGTIINEKNLELSEACQQTIFNGIDVVLTNGETKHFSLKIEDQMNLNSLFAQVSMGAIKAEDGVPYHADGEICSMFSIADFTLVANMASAFKIQQTTYCNHLMSYVRSLEDVEQIKAVTYGQELTGEFLESYNKIVRN